MAISIINVGYYEWLNLSGKNITSMKGLGFPPDLTELNISHNKITSLEGLPSTLTKLYIDNNQITSLRGLPKNLATLYINNNQITSLKGLPTNLRVLKISSNKIKSLKGLPPNLRVLEISGNKIKSLKGLPLDLDYLEIDNNQIKSLEGLPPYLTQFTAHDNHITSLEGLPPNLEILNIYNNRIKTVTGLPQSLTQFNAQGNHITSLEGLTPNLKYINIYNNRITSLPIEICLMRNLIFIDYSGNPIENIHPSIQRFLTSLRNRDTRRGNTIYDDGQNVHNAEVQNSIRESLNSLTKYKQLVTKSKLSEEETSFLDDQEVHSYFDFTQKEVLLFIENAIEVGEYPETVKEELYLLLKEALREGRNVCSTGRIGRMVNVLSGFDAKVQIKISQNSQIGAIVTSFRERGEAKERVAEELKSRGLEKNEIDEWLEYY
jgi:Leucine-rich repeat (LRR) protein